MIPTEAARAAVKAAKESFGREAPRGMRAAIHAALEAARPHLMAGDVEWTVFRASDGPNGSPAENLRYSTKAGAQESIDSRYGTPELWEPRSRVVGEWRK